MLLLLVGYLAFPFSTSLAHLNSLRYAASLTASFAAFFSALILPHRLFVALFAPHLDVDFALLSAFCAFCAFFSVFFALFSAFRASFIASFHFGTLGLTSALVVPLSLPVTFCDLDPGVEVFSLADGAVSCGSVDGVSVAVSTTSLTVWTCCGRVASPSRSVKKSTGDVDLSHLVARLVDCFSAFFAMRRAMYSSRDCFLVAARASYMARFLVDNLAILRSTDADSLLDDFAFLTALLDLSSARLRFVFFSVIFAGASLSDAEVGGVLAPEGGTEASVALAELSSIVPAIASPFTKKPYSPPRLMPLVRIWFRVLYYCVRSFLLRPRCSLLHLAQSQYSASSHQTRASTTGHPSSMPPSSCPVRVGPACAQ